jgi:hypothetical protein
MYQQVLAMAAEPNAQSTVNSYLIIFVGSVLSLLVALALRKLNMIDQRTKNQQECTEERDMLLFEVDAANMELSITTAVAVRDGKNNGNLLSALSHLLEVREKRAQFLNKMSQKAFKK